MKTSEGLPQPEFHKKGIFGVIFGRLPDETGSEKTQESSEKTEKSSEKTQESSEKTEKSSEKTQESSEKIIALIIENPSLTIEGLSIEIGKTTRAIEKQIQKLCEKNRIERIGPDKGGYWKVIPISNGEE